MAMGRNAVRYLLWARCSHTPSSIIRYWPKDSDAMWLVAGKVIAGLTESNSRVTCGLTVPNYYQSASAQRSYPYLYLTFYL